MTGDLAFYSTILGKENMSGAWCYMCHLAHQAWQKLDHEKGDIWSIDEYKKHLQKLNCGHLDKSKAHDVCGVTDHPIFDAVPLQNWIAPVLHICLGVGNGLLKSFLGWLDERIEGVPPTLLACRDETIRLQIKLDDYMEDDWTEWVHEDGVELAKLLFEKQTVNELVTARNEAGDFLLLTAQRRRSGIHENVNRANQNN
jgi:hypothetical protein